MTNAQHELSAKKRTLLGKKAKRLRATGEVAANIFGKVTDSTAITVNAKEFKKVYDEAGDTGVIYVQITEEKNNRPTLVDSVEIDPLSGKVLHVSLRQVNLKEKVSAAVPVELVGELTLQEASANQMVQEIEVEALPTDFPEAFTIDLSQFTEIGQEFTVKQLSYDSSKLSLSLEPDDVLVQIQELQQMAEEPVEVAPVEGAEGATPAEGAEGAAPTTEAGAESAEEKKE